MELFLLVNAIILICFLLLGIRVWIKGEFLEGEIGANPKLQDKGLMCAKEEELRLLNRQDSDCFGGCLACSSHCITPTGNGQTS